MANPLDKKGEWDENTIREVVSEFLTMAHQVVQFQTNILGKISLPEMDSLGLDKINERMKKCEQILTLLRDFPTTIKQINRLALIYETDKEMIPLIEQFNRMKPTIDMILSKLEIHEIINND